MASACLRGLLVKRAGQNGYGFDKILIPDGESRALAELTDAEKFPYLHRTKAVKIFSKRWQIMTMKIIDMTAGVWSFRDICRSNCP